MEQYANYWEKICEIYFLTKHYLILSEEISDDFDTFLQPLKEHRDAFDHIARVYGYKHIQEQLSDVDAYRCENMKKALGHAYRAFFDTADFLTYVCRRKIRLLLQNYSYTTIINRCPEYENIRVRLLEIPEKIAEIREYKDVNESEKVLLDEVFKYKEIMDELLATYKKLNECFY